MARVLVSGHDWWKYMSLESNQWQTLGATRPIAKSARSPQCVALEGALHDRRPPNESVDIDVKEVCWSEPENHRAVCLEFGRDRQGAEARESRVRLQIAVSTPLKHCFQAHCFPPLVTHSFQTQ